MLDSSEEQRLIETLEAQLKSEQDRRAQVESKLKQKDVELARIKQNKLKMQAKAEEEEEFITNNLLKRLDAVKKEKEQLAMQVEIEEEFITNNMQKKLDKLRQEKDSLERHLEVEQEYFVNKLQKQLLEITRQKNALERKLNEGRSGLISQFEQTVGDCKESLHSRSCPQERDSIKHLESQITGMRAHQLQVERDAHEYRERCEQHAKHLEELTKKNAQLEAQTDRYREKYEQLQAEREAEFAQFELSEERQFNLSIRRGSSDIFETTESLRSRGPNTPVSARTPCSGGSSWTRSGSTSVRSTSQDQSLMRTHLRTISDTKMQRSSSGSSNRTSPSPGHCSSPGGFTPGGYTNTPGGYTPPPVSPKRCSGVAMPTGTLLKHHTEKVLSMSPQIITTVVSQEQSREPSPGPELLPTAAREPGL